MKKRIIILFISIVIIILAGFSLTYTVILPLKNNESEITLGIIDGNLSMSHKNIFNSVNVLTEKEKQHGDLVLFFMEKYDSNVKIAYYDAEKNDKITTESLIAGLNWMIDNKVNCVCISLSSAYYSEELETWINKHHEEITIYASYSNLYNTVDYPAQYANVIGVGSGSRVAYKENDTKYRTNKILLIRNGIYLFNGNSYLAPMQMVSDKRKENVYGKD